MSAGPHSLQRLWGESISCPSLSFWRSQHSGIPWCVATSLQSLGVFYSHGFLFCDCVVALWLTLTRLHLQIPGIRTWTYLFWGWGGHRQPVTIHLREFRKWEQVDQDETSEEMRIIEETEDNFNTTIANRTVCWMNGMNWKELRMSYSSLKS